MTLLLILIAIAVQRFLGLTPDKIEVPWVHGYYTWFVRQFDVVTRGHGLFGLGLLVVPILLVVSILFSILFHMFGLLGYSIVSLFLFWYCVDARDLAKRPYAAELSPIQWLTQSYATLFAMIFWYALFGPIGLLLYYIVYILHRFACTTDQVVSPGITHAASQTLNILDWVPVRLFTLSLSLVGHFAQMFTVWLKYLLPGLQSATVVIEACVASVAKSTSDSVVMINRALVVWLVVIALVMIGVLLG